MEKSCRGSHERSQKVSVFCRLITWTYLAGFLERGQKGFPTLAELRNIRQETTTKWHRLQQVCVPILRSRNIGSCIVLSRSHTSPATCLMERTRGHPRTCLVWASNIPCDDTFSHDSAQNITFPSRVGQIPVNSYTKSRTRNLTRPTCHDVIITHEDTHACVL